MSDSVLPAPARPGSDRRDSKDLSYLATRRECPAYPEPGRRPTGRESNGPSLQRLLVTPGDESRAREIIREVLDATPPE
jgi:hypothetical protein